MDRTPRHRLAIATVIVAAAVGLAGPQWVGADAGEEIDRTSAAVSAGAEESTVNGETRVTIATPTTTGPSTTTTVEAVVVPEQPAPDPIPPVAAEAAPADHDPATTEEAPVATTGTLTVEVTPADGATRTVSLRTTDGAAAAGPRTVTGEPIVFAGLEAGTYDLFVEQVADGGGAFLTRTPITISGGDQLVASCDAESLDCSVH